MADITPGTGYGRVYTIATTCARYLGLDSLATLMESHATISGEEYELFNDIIRCINIVATDVAIEAIPLKNRRTVASVNGEILYNAIDRRLCDVKAVFDAGGNKLPFTPYHDRLLCKVSGTLEVEYTYMPGTLTAANDLPFPQYVTDNLIAFGAACEFCLAYDRGAEAVKWEALFAKELDKIERRKLPSAGTLKRRYWL